MDLFTGTPTGPPPIGLRVVRVGHTIRIHKDVQCISLDKLVENAMKVAGEEKEKIRESPTPLVSICLVFHAVFVTIITVSQIVIRWMPGRSRT